MLCVPFVVCSFVDVVCCVVDRCISRLVYVVLRACYCLVVCRWLFLLSFVVVERGYCCSCLFSVGIGCCSLVVSCWC